MKIQFQVLVLMLSFSLLGPVTSRAKTMDELVHSTERPSMTEVMDFMKPNPSLNPFPPPSSWWIESIQLKRKLFGTGIKMLVSLEYAFPKAIWVPVGRTSVNAGDFLDSFYLSEGIQDRVVRLDLSERESMNGLNILQIFIKLNLIDPEGLPLHKFVLLDRTQFFPWSRCQILLASIYYNLPLHLVQFYLPFVNAVDLSHSHLKISSSVDWDEFWKTLPSSDFGPKDILSVAGEKIFSGNWHQDFHDLVRTERGELKAFPGKLASTADRKKILWNMAEMAILVKTAEFRNEVEAFAKKEFGIDFFQRLKQIPSIPQGVERYPPGG